MPVIKPALHHVTFKTNRLDEMIAWYGTVLGGTINFKDDHNAWMTNDEANHRFAFLSVPGLEDDPDKVKHNVMHHCAFEYESFSDLMSSYARMREEGIVPLSRSRYHHVVVLQGPEWELRRVAER